MIRTIVKYGNPALETPAAPVTAFGKELRQLIDDMFETMYAAQGVGLAAPQIAVSQQVIVIDTSFKEEPEDKIVLINPEIIHTEGKQTGEEGCLSFPGIHEKITRPRIATVRYQDTDGEWFEIEGEDLLARAFCHEIDHLKGDVFINHMSVLKRDLLKRRIRKMIKLGEW